MSERFHIVGLGEVLWDLMPAGPQLGGAPANFAAHAASLGAESHVASAVGRDALGDRALQEWRSRGVGCDHVHRDQQHPTGTVAVRLDEAGQATYDFASDTAWDYLPWSRDFAALAERCDALCFGSLGQRSPLSRGTIQRFVKSTRPEALRVFDVNLRQRFYDVEVIQTSLELASAVKLNDAELPLVAELCQLKGQKETDLLIALAEQYGLSFVVLTRGEQGSLLWAKGMVDECPVQATKVEDTVGAGDAFTATVVMGWLRGWALSKINRHANAVAAFVCSQPGATPVLPAKLSQITNIESTYPA